MPTSLKRSFFYRFTSYFLKTAIFFATHKSVVHFILPSEKMATSHQHISVAFPRGCNIPAECHSLGQPTSQPVSQSVRQSINHSVSVSKLAQLHTNKFNKQATQWNKLHLYVEREFPFRKAEIVWFVARVNPSKGPRNQLRLRIVHWQLFGVGDSGCRMQNRGKRKSSAIQ